MKMVDGKLISIEGIDGSGKTRQANLLAERLTKDGHKVLKTFEPGGGAGGMLLRELLTKNSSEKQFQWGPETEALLFTAARRNHLDTCILPAIGRGQIVITDRFADSTRIYQGFGNTELRHKIDQLHDLMIGIEPDLTLIIDIPVKLAVTRVTNRSGGDARLERFGEQLEQLRQNFIALSHHHQDRCKMIDGNRTIDAIASDIHRLVSGILL